MEGFPGDTETGLGNFPEIHKTFINAEMWK
jgi:hypothetical protein